MVPAATSAGFLVLSVKYLFISCGIASFMWIQDCHKKDTPRDPNSIPEKAKSLYNLKQKESEGFKTREFNASKGWFDNFRKRFGLKSVKRTGKAASADQEAADAFPDAIKKINEEKGYTPE